MNTSLTTQQADGFPIITPELLESLDVEKLASLMELKEKFDDRQAEKALNAALCKFQSECPSVFKGRKTDKATYASLDDILFQIRDALTSNGLSISFDTSSGEGTVSATCHVMHSCGASFSRQVTVPVDPNMRVNDTQKMGSAISYSKRYGLIAALNLIVTDNDDDGHSCGTQFLTVEQAREVNELLDKLNDPTVTDALLQWAEAETVEMIPASKFRQTISSLKKKMT